MRRLAWMLLPLLLSSCAGNRPPSIPNRDQGSDRKFLWPDFILPNHDSTRESRPACAATCSGCCQPDGSCAPGATSSRCGKNGSLCVDCKTAACAAGICQGCTPACNGKSCGSGDGCGGTCQPGSGCTSCTPACAGKTCGAANGCGGTCQPGSGCCTPSCGGKSCGSSDGCGGTCNPGSGCTSCTPSCGGKSCGSGDGCGGTCKPGSGCKPSCGQLLIQKGLPDAGLGCCAFGCETTEAGGPGETHDCTYCCSSTGSGACTLPSCGQLLSKKGLPDAGQGCCGNGCLTTQAGGPGETYDCTYCCSSTDPSASVCQ